jgi:tetratricopeptide (TPR) repeat protein
MQTYTLSGIQSMLGLSRAVITGLINAGFVTPTRGKRREYRFSFQDVVLLRTAHGLQAAQIPARRIVRSLQRLKATLPSELPLTGLRITAVGGDVAVRDGDRQWDAESGQLLIDFEVKPARGSVQLLSTPPPAAGDDTTDDTTDDTRNDASVWFDRGVELESSAPAQAEQAYRAAIALAPDFPDPYLNLGVLLGGARRIAEATACYREGIVHCPAEALLHFNLGVGLEDLGQSTQALRAYEACLRLEPTLADAHYNAARLHEQAGHATQAIRHYSEYRRLQHR